METLKREIAPLDGTPEKRLFWSIISDYNITTAICELVDNAVDLWWPKRSTIELSVTINLDAQTQEISIEDNAGGISEADLRLLIAPGGSNNNPLAETIGIFGVGSKRAVVALARDIVIKTHRRNNKTFQLDISEDWLESNEWRIPAYEVSPIPSGTTHIALARLRQPLTQDFEQLLSERLSVVYGQFLKGRRFKLQINGKRIRPTLFNAWAYPTGYSPRRTKLEIDLGENRTVRATITVGLILDRDAEAENYGVCIYCNDRLVVDNLRVREVGYYVGSEAGVPHPDASLCRAIVELHGPASAMPWNSSKTGINYAHPAFQELLPALIPLVSYFSSLSRRLKNQWDTHVFSKTAGEVEEFLASASPRVNKLRLPKLPKARKSRGEQLLQRNQKIVEAKPWTLGLVEAIAAIEIVERQKLSTRNRIALILLDSSFEIALKEYIVHEKSKFPTKTYTDAYLSNLFKNRSDVINAIAAAVPIPKSLIDRAQHYYLARNKLIHERASVDVTDSDIGNYRRVVAQILKILFDLKLS